MILDLFSRYVVGWMVAAGESAQLVGRLIAATCQKQGIAPNQLADPRRPRGADAEQTRHGVVHGPRHRRQPLAAAREQRQSVSEAQFRTFKYRPEFPDRFGSIQDARAICHILFAWYNDAHHHRGRCYLTPADVHYGRAATRLEVRYRTRLAAYAAHPERFVQGPPRRETLPAAVWINPPPRSTAQGGPGTTIVTPVDPQPGVIERPQVIVKDRSIVMANSAASLH